MFLALSYMDMAKLSGFAGYYDLAVEQLRSEIRLAPNFSLGYFLLGKVYNEQRQYRSAVSVLNKALVIDPKFFDVRLEQARAYEGLKNRRQAVKVYQAVLKLDGGNQSAKKALERLNAAN